MPILVCRKCQGNGKVEDIAHYRRKNIARIVCANCGKNWYVSVPPDWDKNDIIVKCGKVSTVNIETDAGTLKIPETSMASAFAKAFAKKYGKGESS